MPDECSSAEDDASRLFIAGDLCCATNHRAEPVADGLQERVSAADVSVVNLEAPVASPKDPIPKSGPTKISTPDTAARLRDAGVDAVTLANNHVMDYGWNGLDATLDACEAEAVATCGAGADRGEAMAPVRTTVDGTSVALFSFCEREFGIAGDDSPGTAWISHVESRARVAEEADRSDLVVVVAHGGVEYVPFPPPRRQTQLRAFVDAGADLVVGHHPHVPQGWEVYHETPIFYSLGNFLFEQPDRTKTDRGLALDVSVADGAFTNVELVPTEQADGRVQELTPPDVADDFLQYLYRTTDQIADRESLVAHWQETAVQLFDQRYTDWLRRGTGARLRDQLGSPAQHVSSDAVWGDGRQDHVLVLLNLFQNESHRAVIETVLGLKTGDREDQRTPAVREEVRDLVAHTEDRPLYDGPSRSRATLRTLVSKLAEYSQTTSDASSQHGDERA
ncbi:MAG: CapA family protein [Haloarculaceae archaeon]